MRYRLLANNNSHVRPPKRGLFVDSLGDGTFFINFLNATLGNLSFVRGPASGKGWAFSSSGSLTEYGTNIPRFDYTYPAPTTARGLLIEGQRTNGIRNPRGEGAVPGIIGAGATLPTNWTAVTGSTATMTLNSVGTEDGFNYLEIRFQASATGTASTINFDSAITVTPSVVYYMGLYVKKISGSGAGISQLSIRPRVTATTVVNGTPTQIYSGSTTSYDRFTSTLTTLADSSNSQVQILFTPNAAADETLRIAAPTYELAEFVSSPIFPDVGSPAVSTRSADVVTASVSTFGITTQYTTIASFTVPQNATAGADQLLFQIDDGTDDNRVRIRNVAGGATIVAGRVVAGVATDAPTVDSLVAGTRFAVGVRVTAANVISACFNGGTLQSVAGAPTGLTTIRIGNNANGTAALFGYAVNFRVVTTVVSNAELQALTTAALS